MALNNSKKDIVIENIEKIKEWVAKGVPMGVIAKNIGVSKTTLYKHINANEKGLDSLDTVKKYRKPAVEELEATMFKRANGFTQKVKKHTKLRHCTYKNGKKVKEWEEVVEYEDTLYFPPDTIAGIFLLKNWASYMNEPATVKLREKEVELKEKQAW